MVPRFEEELALAQVVGLNLLVVVRTRPSVRRPLVVNLSEEQL